MSNIIEFSWLNELLTHLIVKIEINIREILLVTFYWDTKFIGLAVLKIFALIRPCNLFHPCLLGSIYARTITTRRNCGGPSLTWLSRLWFSPNLTSYTHIVCVAPAILQVAISVITVNNFHRSLTCIRPFLSSWICSKPYYPIILIQVVTLCPSRFLVSTFCWTRNCGLGFSKSIGLLPSPLTRK